MQKEQTPKDPDYERKCRESWSKQGFMLRLGAEMAVVEPGFCEIRLAMRPELDQAHGYASGSVLGALADVAGGYAAYSLTPPGFTMLTVEYKINFVNPAAGDLLIGRGWCDKAGRTLSVSRAEVYSVKNGTETLCATALTTLISLPDDPTA